MISVEVGSLLLHKAAALFGGLRQGKICNIGLKINLTKFLIIFYCIYVLQEHFNFPTFSHLVTFPVLFK